MQTEHGVNLSSNSSKILNFCLATDPCQLGNPCALVAGSKCHNQAGNAVCVCKQVSLLRKILENWINFQGFVRQVKDQRDLTAPCHGEYSLNYRNIKILEKVKIIPPFFPFSTWNGLIDPMGASHPLSNSENDRWPPLKRPGNIRLLVYCSLQPLCFTDSKIPFKTFVRPWWTTAPPAIMLQVNADLLEEKVSSFWSTGATNKSFALFNIFHSDVIFECVCRGGYQMNAAGICVSQFFFDRCKFYHNSLRHRWVPKSFGERLWCQREMRR